MSDLCPSKPLGPAPGYRRPSKDFPNVWDNEFDTTPFVQMCNKDPKGYKGPPKQQSTSPFTKEQSTSGDATSLVRSSFQKLYRTKIFKMEGSVQVNDGCNSDPKVPTCPTAPGSRCGSRARTASFCDTESNMPLSSIDHSNLHHSLDRRNSAPAAVGMPATDFIKSIKHYCVPAPKEKWVHLLCRLFDETLLHPHALVYCDESMAGKAFYDQVNESNLTVRAHQCEEVQDPANTSQFLVTNPKFSTQLSQPILSCIFHMDSSNKSPMSYGARLLPVDEKCSWDSISVLFVEPQDVKTVSDIETMFDIEFREIPFDVPEISMRPKRSWRKGSVTRGRWWKM
eukprot:gnl/MRDRNA2_/MRDRNA2_69674_c0_seq1.p1 gnl/MRDRNA2_/MRDRNA2_69674_c0~~gnl/MRDRNA2_/MRDRNA2_69674_c0_seq1.p1  ORF type:complete len:354 (-),score=42.81 gnl/MRDRNA2_/MRDRNA2_69674_c0_seq1:273-1292(-)